MLSGVAYCFDCKDLFFTAGLAVQSVKVADTDIMLYMDDKLSSSCAERPIVICPGAETEELVVKIIEQLDQDADEVFICMNCTS